MLPDNYQPPTLTVECVIFQIIDGQLTTLIGRVRSELYRGQWALPGGFCNAGETTVEALERNIREKAEIEIKELGLVEQLHTFDIIADDERGHVVDVVFYALGNRIPLTIEDDFAQPAFTPISKLPTLAYGHGEFVDVALKQLRTKLRDTTAAVALMPRHFTLTQLQQCYEAVYGHALDKRNFRKKILSYDMLEATDDWNKDGAHRPARLYRFKSQNIQPLNSDFS